METDFFPLLLLILGGVCACVTLAILALLIGTLLAFGISRIGAGRAMKGLPLPRKRTGFWGGVRRIQQLSRLQQHQQYVRLQQEKQLRHARILAQSGRWEQLDPREFELYVGMLFTKFGCVVQHTGKSHDGGIDLIMEKNGRRGIAQCKRYAPNHPVSSAEIRNFRGAILGHAEFGFFVTTSYFTPRAILEAQRCAPSIRLFDSLKLRQLILDLDAPPPEFMRQD